MSFDPTDASLPEDDVRLLARLAEVLDRVRDVHPDMTVNMLLALVAYGMKPGVTQAELSSKYGYPKTTINRITQTLGASGSREVKGLDLLSKSYGPGDERSKLVAPTPKGWRLIGAIVTALKGGRRGSASASE